MRLAKRLLLAGSLTLAVVLATLAVVWFYIGRPGSTRIEDWIGHHIVTVLENYITPEVEFVALDYRRPRTVVIRGLTLTSEGRPMVTVNRALLELAEVPRESEPIQIQRIELDEPRISLEMRADGRLSGWADFIRPEVRREPQSVSPGERLSDILVLRHVEIRNGEVRYQAAGEEEPMVLPGIRATLETARDADEPGWYRLAGSVMRDPILQADVDGRINLDTGLLELAAVKLAATLGEEQYATLPPRLQQILRRHEARGRVIGTFKGRVPLRDPASAEGALQAELEKIRLKINEASLAFSSGRLEAGLPDAPIRIEVNNGSFRSAGRTLIAAKRITGELPGIPRGLPVEVTRFEADSPAANLIEDPAGGFVGWNRLTGEQTSTAPAESDREALSETPVQPAAPVEEASADPQQSSPPANPYVRVREGQIRNGRFVYGTRGGGRPLVLQNIDINLQPAPEGGRQWQPVTASGRSGRLFRMSLTGRFKLASLILDLDRFNFQTNIQGGDQYALLPGAVESLFRKHGVTGLLRFTFRGTVPLTRIQESQGKGRADLRNMQLQFAGVAMPAERAVFDFDVPAGTVQANVSNLALIGDELPIVEVRRLRFDLAEPPRGSGPLEVRTARFEHPRLRFVKAPDPESGLLGWRRLIDPKTPWPRLSDFARFQEVQIWQGEVLYDDNDGKGEPMVLTQINMQMRTPQLQDTPGWYRLESSIHRQGLFSIELDGRINPDEYLLEFSRLQFEGALSQDHYAIFPPRVQEALRSHEIRGRLSLTARGTVPLNHFRNTEATIRAELTNAHMALDQTVWPIDRVIFDATLDDGDLGSQYTADLFGGTVTGSVGLKLDDPQPLSVTWTATDVRMEDTLRAVEGGEPKYAGLLSTDGEFSMNLDEGSQSLRGGGTIQVSQGKLVRLPVIRAVAAAVSTATLGLIPRRSDTAHARFQLWPDHVEVDQLTISSDAVDLRLSGRISYEKTVDMRATVHTAGNIGRKIGTGVGRVGEIATLGILNRLPEDLGEVFGGVSNALAVGERIVTYRVTGPLSNPHVSMNGLGQR